MSNTIVPIKKKRSNGASTEHTTTMKGLVYYGSGKVKKTKLKTVYKRNKA
jgi:hypothetical protein